MGGLRRKIFYTVVGASSGLAGLTMFSKCGGTACTSCFGCGAIGITALVIALFHRVKAIQRRHPK